MSELSTKTLSELTTVDSLASTDKVLIESGGLMKRVNANAVGGGIFVLDVSNYYDESEGLGINNITDTTIYNNVLEAMDKRQLIMLTIPSDGIIYIQVGSQWVHRPSSPYYQIYCSYIRAGGIISSFFINPSTESGLYTPTNLTAYEITLQ